MAQRVFLSHSTLEKTDIQALRKALADRGVAAWEDVLGMRLGDDATAKIRSAIRDSQAFVLLLSQVSAGSDWVRREVQWALEESMMRPEYRLLVLLRGTDRAMLRILFGAAEPIYFQVPPIGPWSEDAASTILHALGAAATDGLPRKAPMPPPPIAELLLEFSHLKLDNDDGNHHVGADLRLRYTAPGAANVVEGVITEFVSPLGSVEAEELRWCAGSRGMARAGKALVRHVRHPKPGFSEGTLAVSGDGTTGAGISDHCSGLRDAHCNSASLEAWATRACRYVSGANSTDTPRFGGDCFVSRLDCKNSQMGSWRSLGDG